jgi:uncharacterized protein YeaO (DUF488 family)
MIAIKRIYDESDAYDGYRVLVDRVWPRGISKERAGLDEWLRDVAPTEGLRKWFGHTPERFDTFRERYKDELKTNPALQQLQHIVRTHKTVTLLYGARDEVHNQARVLREYLETN